VGSERGRSLWARGRDVRGHGPEVEVPMLWVFGKPGAEEAEDVAVDVVSADCCGCSGNQGPRRPRTSPWT